MAPEGDEDDNDSAPSKHNDNDTIGVISIDPSRMMMNDVGDSRNESEKEQTEAENPNEMKKVVTRAGQ